MLGLPLLCLNRLRSVVAKTIEEFCKQIPEIVVVVDYQYCFSTGHNLETCINSTNPLRSLCST